MAPPPAAGVKPCPACSHPNRLQARFCRDCGKPLGGGPAARRDPIIGVALALAAGIAVVIGAVGFMARQAEERSGAGAAAPTGAAPAAPGGGPAAVGMPDAPRPPAPGETGRGGETMAGGMPGGPAQASPDPEALRKYQEATRRAEEAQREYERIHREHEALKAAEAAGIDWVTIPGGSFMMGSGNGDEWPRHPVTVRTFQLAKTLVTNKQYKACVDAGACEAPHASDGTCYVYNESSWGQGVLSGLFQGDDQPVVCVDWEQARAFSEWAGGRLPSEAEWEYAARSGGWEWEYPWGNEAATCARAVIDDGGAGCGRNSTWPVCSKPAGNTRQGLCDMAGNAWEWVQDWYHDSYNGAPTDGSAWEDTGSLRVTRGGSWNNFAANARSAFRNDHDPGYRIDSLGFRPAR